MFTFMSAKRRKLEKMHKDKNEFYAFVLLEQDKWSDKIIQEACDFLEVDLDAEGKPWVKEDADHSNCWTSSTICECTSSGKGVCDEYGYWQIPCYHCARKNEKKAPEIYGECWPRSRESLEEWEKGQTNE